MKKKTKQNKKRKKKKAKKKAFFLPHFCWKIEWLPATTPHVNQPCDRGTAKSGLVRMPFIRCILGITRLTAANPH